jgi:hypothetical protein
MASAEVVGRSESHLLRDVQRERSGGHIVIRHAVTVAAVKRQLKLIVLGPRLDAKGGAGRIVAGVLALKIPVVLGSRIILDIRDLNIKNPGPAGRCDDL